MSRYQQATVGGSKLPVPTSVPLVVGDFEEAIPPCPRPSSSCAAAEIPPKRLENSGRASDTVRQARWVAGEACAEPRHSNRVRERSPGDENVTNSATRTAERGLLELEGLQEESFAEALRRLMRADHFALFVADAEGQHRLWMSDALPRSVEASLSSEDFDPREACGLGAVGGRVALHEGDFSEAPLARLFPNARWVLAAAGGGCSFAAVLVGRSDPPRDFLADPLLVEALLRRLGDQIQPATASDLSVAAQALSRLSHEFKTPLVSIKGHAELILDTPGESTSPKCREWARRIARAANRLAALYRKITAEARSEASWVYDPKPVDFGPWTRRCLDEVSALTESRNLHWSLEAEEGLAAVSLDPDAGRDMILELLQNAVRATPDGGEIRLRVRREARDGRPGVHLTIEDTGVGIPVGPDTDRLFDRFVTLQRLLEHHSGDFEFGAGGLGLGLALVRGVVRAHGGEVWAEGRGRDPNKLPGSAFHVWLPAQESVACAEDTGVRTERGRLLVVDPDPGARGILEEALSGSYEVIAAGTPETALELWRSGGEWQGCIVEPLLTDARGVELLRNLRMEAGPNAPPILAYTTATAPAQTAAWRAAGADTCVAKPARARLLRQRLRAISSRRSRP